MSQTGFDPATRPPPRLTESFPQRFQVRETKLPPVSHEAAAIRSHSAASAQSSNTEAETLVCTHTTPSAPLQDGCGCRRGGSIWQSRRTGLGAAGGIPRPHYGLEAKGRGLTAPLEPEQAGDAADVAKNI
ncbi:hypothetical protein E2C01_076980 [Portunus trituberculatus]|uniref:Uncharacterized protein n=1 Tax=Portunus trituberculatus TaxID=210409 RepID=A0A5B7IEM4_PORTR|nr:hypothetical protein [Portunus trituberculatus]